MLVAICRRRTRAFDPHRRKRVMFGLGLATKIYIAVEAIDMRKGFEGLHGLVRDHLGQDPLSGHLFLFTNRTKTRLKALVWDGSGLWVCAKRVDACGRVGDAGERAGREANQAAQLVSQNSVKMFWNRWRTSLTMELPHGGSRSTNAY